MDKLERAKREAKFIIETTQKIAQFHVDMRKKGIEGPVVGIMGIVIVRAAIDRHARELISPPREGLLEGEVTLPTRRDN